MTVFSPRGFHSVPGYHASMSSYFHAWGACITTNRSSKPTDMKTRYSLTGGKSFTCSRRSMPTMSSTAVMLHRVGTNRRLSSSPKAPTLKARWIWVTGTSSSWSHCTASRASQSVSEVALSRCRSTFTLPRSTFFKGAEGPKGCTLSSRRRCPEGFFMNSVSVSAGVSARASSRVASTIRPPCSTLWTSTRCMPRTSWERKSMMSSMVRSTQRSGASRRLVSPWTGGVMGPTNTFG